MALKYSVIEIYTSEAVRCQKGVLYESLVAYIRGLKIASRCMVYKGIEGCYESGEIVTSRVMNLSYNMPLKVEIVLPSAEVEQVRAVLEDMICEGIIAVRELPVVMFKTRKRLFPSQIRVRDVMTPSPVSVKRSATVEEVVRILLSYQFTGLPVVDDEGRPVGVISQGDLIFRAKLPLRPGLLSRTDPERREAVLRSLKRLTASEIMSPDVHIHEEAMLTEAVRMMLHKEMKRLPVVDAWGKLTGILSRRDIFRTVTRESPDWKAIQAQSVTLENLQTVADLMKRDVQTVLPETPVMEVIRIIDAEDTQSVAVVGKDGSFKGLISEDDLLAAFSDEEEGIWDYLTRLIPFAEKRKRHAALGERLQARAAGEVMQTDVKTIGETEPIESVIAMMTQNHIKRLPVVDAEGRFKGMVSRESLLRSGFVDM